MALTPARIYSGVPGTADAVIYTVSATAGSYVIVKEVLITNTTAAAATISFGLNGTAATAANAIWAFGMSIDAHSLITIGLSTVLNASDVLHALQGTASALSVQISAVTGP